MNQRSIQPLTPAPHQMPATGEIVLDFGQIFSILRRGWWVIGSFGMIGAAVAAYFALNAELIYRSQAQLLMGQQSRVGGALSALVQDLNLDDDAIAGEISIITSGRILSMVSQRLDLASRPEFNAALRPPEPEPGAFAQLLEQAEESVKSLFIETTSEVEAGDAPEADVEVPLDPILAAAEVGRNSLGEQAEYVEALRRGLRVNRVGNSNLVDLRFTSTDPLLAAAIPNEIADIYLEDQLNRKFAALRRVSDGLSLRLDAMRDRLEESERAVIDFRTQNLAEGFGSQERLKQQLGDLSRRVNQVIAEREELASDLAGIDNLIADRGLVVAAGLFESELLETMHSQAAELTQRRNLLLERFGEDSVQVRDVDDEIKSTEVAISAEVSRLRNNHSHRVVLAEDRVQALQRQLALLEAHAIEQAERELQLTQYERDHATEQAVYASFLDKFTESSEAVNLQEGDAQIISYADPPPAPIAPNKKLAVALGGIAGAFGGIGLLFLRAFSDNSVRNQRQMRSLLAGVYVKSLPRVHGFLFSRINPLDHVARNPHGKLAEGIRSLRSYLMLSPLKTPGQVIAVVSTSANCGRTTTCLLLARSVAQMDTSCAVVDADLRQAAISDRMELPSRPDIVDILDGSVPVSKALQKDRETDLRILTARQNLADPAGALLSDNMVALVNDLRQSFSFVIFDTTPLGDVSDAAAVVKAADKVVFVVKHGTPKGEVRKGLDVLARTGAKDVSVVISMTPDSQM